MRRTCSTRCLLSYQVTLAITPLLSSCIPSTGECYLPPTTPQVRPITFLIGYYLIRMCVGHLKGLAGLEQLTVCPGIPPYFILLMVQGHLSGGGTFVVAGKDGRSTYCTQRENTFTCTSSEQESYKIGADFITLKEDNSFITTWMDIYTS